MYNSIRIRKETGTIIQFILPALIVLSVFVFIPILQTTVMSFQQWSQD